MFARRRPGDGWSGFYVGGNLGYGFAHSTNRIVNSSGLQNENFALGVTGAVGGGQFGYNWHVSPNWVAGLEADFQGANQTASACTDICHAQFGLFAVTEQTISWFGTVRGRVGWTNGPSLVYVTGGWAYGQVKTFLNEKLSASRAHRLRVSGRARAPLVILTSSVQNHVVRLGVN